MTSLADFRRPILVAGKPLDSGATAYRMDGGKRDEKCPDMRGFAKLGTANCCDYFLPVGDAVVLIEESQLLRQMLESIAPGFSYLSEGDLLNFAVQRFKWENRLKVYCSMLLLCRLASSADEARLRDEVREETRIGRYDFWLVISDEVGPDDERILDNMTDDLQTELRGLLSKKGIREVKVLRRAELESRLSSGE